MVINVWVAAMLAYLIFRLWYDGLRRPLSAEEIEGFMRILQERAVDGLDSRDIETVREFMSSDDGKEFIMVNLIEFNPSPVKHPDTGQDISALRLMQAYFRPFMKTLSRRAGYPVLMSRAVGGYLDAWNTPPDPGWHAAGLVRYRSRRDAMLASLASPEFGGIHKYKTAAVKQTFAVPTQIQVAAYASPRVTVALVLALGAALLHIALS